MKILKGERSLSLLGCGRPSLGRECTQLKGRHFYSWLLLVTIDRTTFDGVSATEQERSKVLIARCKPHDGEIDVRQRETDRKFADRQADRPTDRQREGQKSR